MMKSAPESENQPLQNGIAAVENDATRDDRSRQRAFSLTPIDARKRAEQVRDSLLQLIREGQLKHGDKLPTEPQLSAMFGVGRSSVREAVQSLVGLGIIEMRRGRGAFVSRVSLNDLVRMMDGAVRLEYGAALQLHEVRAMIEITGARLAATRRTEEDIAAAQVAIDDYANYPVDAPNEALVSSDLAFHRAVIRAAHNEMLNQLLNSISGLLRQHRRQYAAANEPSLRDDVIKGHTAILSAITDADPRLAALRMQYHMRTIWAQIEALAIHEDDAVLGGQSYLPMYDEDSE
jgi:GntR family transcriptional repressor for pyruvate dehydrogenase complex